jgi:heptosyltransferase-2
MSFPRRCLVVGPAWVGDMVMAQALFKKLKDLGVDQLDVFSPPWTQTLLARMPEVDQGLVSPFDHGDWAFRQRVSLGKSWQNHYDAAIVLPRAFKAAIVPWAAQIPIRLGWLGEMRFKLLTHWKSLDKQKHTRTVDQFLALPDILDSGFSSIQLQLPALTVDFQQQDDLIQKFALDRQRKIVALCPGAEFGAAKRWPVKHYVALANMCIQQGWQVLLMGSPKDQVIAKDIESQVQPNAVINTVGLTKMLEAIDLLALASMVVSNDSGLMHVASALGRPVWALFGPTSPLINPPLSKNAHLIYREPALACQPCHQRECPLKHQACLDEILPSQVFSQMIKIID